MMLKKKTILACTVKLLLCITAHAQTADTVIKHDTTQKIAGMFLNYYPSPVFKNAVPGNFYSKQLPFFCSKELQIQKTVGFPIKFRLGSVEYCDKLEGKNK